MASGLDAWRMFSTGELDEDCARCDGLGSLLDDTPCRECGGSGLVSPAHVYEGAEA